ncbi:MAG: low molecular weight protein-tyrosine-phosphatase [Nitriliruptoraceae bacterium]
MTRPVVLTVCLGNICRSPTAEAAIRDAAAAAGVDLDVRSAGTGDWHLGHPPNPKMVHAAAQRGLTIEGTAEQVDVAMLRAADLVVAMDATNLADLRRIADDHGLDTRIELFRTFDPEADVLDVPDPYGGSDDAFDHVVEICLRTAPHVVTAVTARQA